MVSFGLPTKDDRDIEVRQYEQGRSTIISERFIDRKKRPQEDHAEKAERNFSNATSPFEKFAPWCQRLAPTAEAVWTCAKRRTP